ncbi:unnamed protein product [Sphagnum troendelagicum]|uniref:Uncharacterized protein n=1 Tax=Sphagnum jensenii TaxID=128206 RepID=A0ABP0W886_9BRYO
MNDLLKLLLQRSRSERLIRSGNALSTEFLDCQFWTTEMADVLLKLAANKQIRTLEKEKGRDHVQDQTYSSPKLVKKTRQTDNEIAIQHVAVEQERSARTMSNSMHWERWQLVLLCYCNYNAALEEDSYTVARTDLRLANITDTKKKEKKKVAAVRIELCGLLLKPSFYTHHQEQLCCKQASKQ